jgi:hypothetical protein
MKSLLNELPQISDDDLESVVESADTKVSSRRLGGRVKSANLKPMIHEGLRTVVVPETFKEADNYLGLYALKAAKKLGYTVRVIPYVGDRHDIPKDTEEVSLGIYMSLSDSEANFRFTKKIDNYERGRSYARSQSIIGALISNNMDTTVLKENHEYFGNFRPKSGADEKDKKPNVDYWIHTLPSYILEKGLAQECAKLIVTLMRHSWTLINPDTLWQNMVPNFIPYGTVVREHCSKEVVVEPAKGRKPAVTKARVPQKVRSNALLLAAEIGMINRYSEPLFRPTPFESLSQDEWVQTVFANGLSKIKRDLSNQYNLRAAFLSRLASLTTKRLRLLRATSEANKTKRKADVSATDLTSLLLGRVNPVQDFAQEILSLDPNGDLFLKEYFVGDNYDWNKIGGGSNLIDYIKQKITLDIDTIGTYSELLSAQEEKKRQISTFLESFKAKEDARNAYFLSLQNKYGANLVNKWSANVLTYDFPSSMKDKGKIKNKGKKATTIVVPHEPTKSQNQSKRQKQSSKGKRSLPLFKMDPEKGYIFENSNEEFDTFIKEVSNDQKSIWISKPSTAIFLYLEKFFKGLVDKIPKEYPFNRDYLSIEGNTRDTLWSSVLSINEMMEIPNKNL